MTKKTFDTGLDIRGSNSDIFENQSHHQEHSRHRNFRGCSGVVGVFSILSVILTTTQTMVSGP